MPKALIEFRRTSELAPAIQTKQETSLPEAVAGTLVCPVQWRTGDCFIPYLS